MISKKASLLRRPVVAAAMIVLAACSNVAQAATFTMYRDPECGCCLSWADHVEDGMRAKVASVDSNGMAAIKTARSIPQELWSCHTMEVDGYIIEGHVPAEAVAMLLRERPAGVAGLSVPGMPLGSPGMEAGGQNQPYEVIAFGPSGQRVFASYP